MLVVKDGLFFYLKHGGCHIIASNRENKLQRTRKKERIFEAYITQAMSSTLLSNAINDMGSHSFVASAKNLISHILTK